MNYKIFNRYHVMILVLGVIFVCCNPQPKTGNVANNNSDIAKWEERLFVVNIVPGDQKLKEYLNYHQHIWPEVEAGFKKAGYQKITMSRFKNLVVMSVVIPKGANLDSISKVAEDSDPKCAEWNRVMGTYQVGVPGTQRGQKWVETKQFYSFENE